MCGGGPPPGTSCDSTALTTPSVSRPWMRMTIGMPRTFIFLPPSDGIWIGFINICVIFSRLKQRRPHDTPSMPRPPIPVADVRLQFIRRALTYADLNNDRTSGGALLEPFTERLLLLSLGAINFTTIVDFIIIMPLGPQYMRVFSFSPAQFGIIVSS